MRIEIEILTNNLVEPFQNLNLNFISLNKLFTTQSLAEHGLGYLICVYEENEQEKRNSNTFFSNSLKKKIIFDTGSTNKTFIHNSNIRGYSLYDVDIIALSHWHYDHTGALYDILAEIDQKIPVILHDYAKFERFFRRSPDVKDSDLKGKKREEIVQLINEMKLVNQPPINEKKIEELNGELILTKDPYTLFDSNNLKIILSGEIQRSHPEEKFHNFFALQGDYLEEDKILDDKCVIIESKNNAIILNGCCHSGLMNTIDYARSITSKPITHIIGGFHMASASAERIEKTIDYIKDNCNNDDIIYLFPVHCTGPQFIKKVGKRNDPKIKAFNISVGTKFIFKY
ncbi:MAG: MBL fold metallo-hydrolase [Promethearchaeota archaeon]